MSAFKMTLRIIVGAALFFFGLLLLLGCAGIATAQVEPPTLESFRAAPGSAPTPNQSYLAKQMQTRMAACIASVVNELSNRARVSPRAWQVPDNVLWEPIGWRIGHQHFDYRPAARHGSQPRPIRVGDVHQRPLGSDLFGDHVRHQADRAGRQAEQTRARPRSYRTIRTPLCMSATTSRNL